MSNVIPFPNKFKPPLNYQTNTGFAQERFDSLPSPEELAALAPPGFVYDIIDPREQALIILRGPTWVKKLFKRAKEMGYNYEEALEYGCNLVEAGVFTFGANSNVRGKKGNKKDG